MKFFIC